MSEKSLRTCETCACSLLMKHPQHINESVMMCRRNPPLFVQQNVRTEAGMATQQALTYPPTSKDLTCFDGWRPIGTQPGEHT